jgi:Predicted membrane protein
MSFITLLLLAFGLSMDAFAVAICKGLAMRRITVWKAVTVGLYFGVFQAGMPLLGYYLGSVFESKVTAVGHWIAFALLCIIGARMIQESFSKEEKPENDSLAVSNMLILAVATSIDAFAVGISFAFLNVNIAWAVTFIGLITFALSTAGVKIGSVFGVKYKSRAEFVGGAVLIALGIKTLLEHIL